MEIINYSNPKIEDKKSLLEDLKTLKLILPSIINNMDKAEDIKKMMQNG